MFRRLIVMRHAKSSWKSDAVDDHSRPLNKRGRRDSPVVGGYLQTVGWLPELVLSSDSVRTRQTLELMMEHFDPRPQVEYLAPLYHGGIHALREALAGVSPELKTVMALGHNPGWEEAVAWLTGEDVRLTTANAALLESGGESWRSALQGEGAWHLIDVVRPKALLAQD